MKRVTNAGLGFLLIGVLIVLVGLWKMYSGAHGTAATILAWGLGIELAGFLLLQIVGNAAGYVLLIGFLAVVAGAWRYFYAVHTSADTIMLAGAVLVHGGAVLAGWAQLPADPVKAPVGERAGETVPHYAGARDVREDGHFIVIENFEDTLLDRVSALLRRDPRVMEVYYDSGQYHSTPDGDELPEWFALRVDCKREAVADLMRDAEQAIARELGAEAAKRLSIRSVS
ncbi:MAG: hypothetical protein KDJ29_19155 [Hyphomicrobiales bacterium]|nr:hypothetical protein [Hyphomicrobiales bacterium]